MRVRVLFFGQLKEIAGTEESAAELAAGARVEDLFAQYVAQFPQLAAFRGVAFPAVNQEFTRWQTPLADGDEVAFLPPVSGGAVHAAAETGHSGDDICEIVCKRILSDAVVAALKAPDDGAVVIFEGIVRNNSHGRETLFLEYEAYESMAVAQMRKIGAEMRARFSIRQLAIVHRLGRLEIGETSVLIAVVAAHRGAAFDACRYGIDTLKRRVPIWKKEYFVDGAVWAEGLTPDEKPFSPPDESKPG